MIGALIVDDSSFMRKALSHILQADESINVVGTAVNGKDALLKVKRLHPDVVILDIKMPVMDGLAALGHIMVERPTPVLMLSGLDKKDADIAVESLDHGAVDFIPKPSGVISYDIDKLAHEIIAKVKIAAAVDVRKLDPCPSTRPSPLQQPERATRTEIVVIGASTGGPRAVATVLSGLPHDLSTAIIVVQHMSQEFVPSFVDRLQWGSALSVSTARKGDVMSAGRAFVAPGDCHITVAPDRDAHTIRCSRNASPHAVFPSIDYAMESVAHAYGEGAVGVLLTGIGSDGARGLQAIKDAGGSTIAEDQSTCVVFGMPKAAMQLGCVDEMVPLPLIAETILRMI